MWRQQQFNHGRFRRNRHRHRRRAEVTIRVGYVTTAQHPYGISIGKYKAAVEAASGGKIAINPIPGASGANDVTLLDDVSGGSIEAAAVSTAVWGSQSVKVFQPLQAAFLITNYPLDEEVLGGSIGQSMLADPNGPPKLGLVGLGLLEGGIRKPMGAKAALDEPRDRSRARSGALRRPRTWWRR